MVQKASNLMGFHQISNKTHRSTFDLSRRNLFTSKIGELLPVFCEEVLPGDDIKVNMQHFSRSMPVQTAAFTRLRENIQFFFVPYTSLYYRFRECMQNMTVGQNGQNISRSAASPSADKQLTTELPYFLMSDLNKYFQTLLSHNNTGYAFCNERVLRISDTAKLLMALGYGNFEDFAKLEINPDTGKLVRNGKDLSVEDIQSMIEVLESNRQYQKTALSPFRLLAYHRIANDYYRYMQWQPWRSYSCNVDYLNGESSHIFNASSASSETTYYDAIVKSQKNIFDMEYSNLPLDYFNGAIPNQQFGDESVVNLGVNTDTVNVIDGVTYTTSRVLTEGDVRLDNPRFGSTHAGDDGLFVANTPLQVSNPVTNNQFALSSTDAAGNATNAKFMRGSLSNEQSGENIAVTSVSTSSKEVQTGSAASLSILALRKATALQRYKEIQNCHDADFVDQIKAHFGVTPSSNGEKSVFLGGYSATFDINPQVNQNLTDGNYANIQAAPTAQGNGSFHYKAKDYGVIIGLYRITPQIDYANLGMDRRILMTDAADYPIPELDSIGMQETLPSELITPTLIGTGKDLNVDALVKEGIGYAPRYCEWKISHDSYQGAFLDTLKTWVTGQNLSLIGNMLADSDTIAEITPTLLVCAPNLVKDVFVNQNLQGGINNDQFMVGSYISVVAKRNLSRYGLPY